MKNAKSVKAVNTVVELSVDQLETVSPDQLSRMFELAWHSDRVSGTQYASMHSAYIMYHIGDAYSPQVEAQWLMDKAIQAFNRDRLELVSAYDEEEGVDQDTKLTDIPGMAGIKRAWDSARRASAQYASKITFNTIGRLTALQILEGATLAAEIDSTGYQAKSETGETAKAKGAKRKAKGAKVENPADGASALETISGSYAQAKNAILVCLKAYPKLANSPDVKQAFADAFAICQKAESIKPKAKAKAKKAA